MTLTHSSKVCRPQIDPVCKHLIVFVHIPKTAGTALSTLVQRNYKEIFYLRGSHQPEGTNMKDWVDAFNQKNRLLQSQGNSTNQFLSGHFGFGLHKFLDVDACTYITLLRDPVERVISNYYQLRTFGTHTPIGQAANSMDLETFLLTQKCVVLDNLQTRFLSGVGWQQATQAFADGFFSRDEFHVKYGDCTQEMLETAKSNLTNYFIFGLQERFPESSALFSELFDWQDIPDRKIHFNDSRPKKDELSQEIVQLIENLNALDIQLYQYAADQFDAQKRLLSTLAH